MSSQSPRNSPWYLTLIRYVVTFGSLAGGYSLAQKMTQQLGLQIVITLAIGVAAGLISFIDKVRQKIETSLVDQTAAWLPSALRNAFASYRKRYLRGIAQAHKFVEFYGLAQRPPVGQQLSNIFVEPEVALTAPHLASSHPLPSKQALLSGSYPIWHYLNDKRFKSDVLVVLGAAGSGKTMLVKHLALVLSRPRFHTRSHHIYHLRRPLPMLLYLREHHQTIKSKPEATLPELVQSQSQGIPLQWFERQLKRGTCLIMFDGLDEVADKEERVQIVAWIHRQTLSYANNRFILTSRPHGYSDTPLDNATVLATQPFTFEQIKIFAKNWYLADGLIRSGKHDSGMRRRAQAAAGNLLVRLSQKTSLLELAANPLFLTMIVILHSNGGALPEKRQELYSEIIQALLYRRRAAIGLTIQLSALQKLTVLQPLAAHMIQHRCLELPYERICSIIAPYLARVSSGSDIAPDSFLKEIEQNSGLLLEISSGTWIFAHQTLQEYMAATYFKESRKETLLLKHLSDDWWHETICFYCAQTDATKIIQACLAQAETSVQMLNLALACNAQKLKDDGSGNLDRQIIEILHTGTEDSDPDKRHIVAEALLQRRLENMVYLSDEVYLDPEPISFAEYQLFLDDQSTQGRYYQPWHWNAATFQSGQGRKPLLGVQFQDALVFCSWLTARENGRWRYRLPHKDEATSIISCLNQPSWAGYNAGFWIENRGFIWIDGKEPKQPDLAELIKDQLVRDRAQALSYDLVRDRNRQEPIDQALELERKLDETRIPDIIPSLTQAIKVHPVALDRVSALPDLLYEIVKAETPTLLKYLVEKDVVPPYTQEEQRLRWFIRYQSQLQARRVFAQIQQMSAQKPQRHSSLSSLSEKSFLEQSFQFYRVVSIDLALLELRRRRKLEAWEGILLVKERVQGKFS